METAYRAASYRKIERDMKKLTSFLIIMLSAVAVWAQTGSRTITGRVLEKANNQPLPGVTVIIKGTQTSAHTNAQGRYSLTVPNNKTVLIFSFIGYNTQEIAVGKRDSVNAYLEAANTALNEVVVVGYGSKMKKEVTSSIASVNVGQAVRGRVAGVSATPGAAPRMVLRGNASPSVYGYSSADYSRQMAQSTDNESYGKFAENKYFNPKETPLSTFSVDVDAAGYSNIRRFLNQGQLPPKDAVRIEEMINYFKYKFPEPKDGEPVAIQTEMAAAPWNPQHRLLRVGIKARTIPTDKLPASNLVFLIDVSGSMSGPNRLPLVKESMKLLVDQLRAKDRVSIVVYAGAAGLVLPATPGDQKEKIIEALDRLEAGGSTAGGAGIMLAYKTARENFMKGGNNRVILATDGDFNVGASSDQSMEELITKERENNIDLSIMGYGMGNYKDSKMEILADKGNGNYAYIDNLSEARKALVSEFGGTMFTVAKDVKLQIEFNPAKVQAYRLIGYENRILNKEDFNNDKKDAGDMGSGHTVTAFYEIIPPGVKDEFTSVDPLKYQKETQTAATSPSVEVATVKFRYKQPGGNKSKLSQAVVMDESASFDKLSSDFRFAAAVAEVGMLLRDSEFKGNASYTQAIEIARAARGNDADGYRAEFIRLTENAKALSRTSIAKSDK